MGHFHPAMSPPQHGGKGPLLGVAQKRVFSSPKDKFDPHLEACFPVLYEGEDLNPTWEPLPIKIIKKLKQACSSYWATAPYTLTLLKTLSARWMMPHDWRTVTKVCLSRGQYLL